jgi:hypothetical protein
MSMRERAWSIGAQLDIVSRPGSGTAVVVERRNDELDLSAESVADDEPAPDDDPNHAELDTALYDDVEYAVVDEEHQGL